MAQKALPVFLLDRQHGWKQCDTAAQAIPYDPHSTYFHVLVADDNESDRLLTLCHLGRTLPVELDILVDCARDGVEALDRLRSHTYSLAVIDCDMPYLSGPEVVRAMHAEDLHIPVVLISGVDLEMQPFIPDEWATTFLSKGNLTPGTLHDAVLTSMRLNEVRRAMGLGMHTDHR
jgi:CheY-like chemotaxis protein